MEVIKDWMMISQNVLMTLLVSVQKFPKETTLLCLFVYRRKPRYVQMQGSRLMVILMFLCHISRIFQAVPGDCQLATHTYHTYIGRGI